jgi:beta-aspartyl-peptidase (threonine type)
MGSGASPEEAAASVIARLTSKLGVTGGLIAVDARGRWGLARSTATMSFAVVTGGGEEAGV